MENTELEAKLVELEAKLLEKDELLRKEAEEKAKYSELLKKVEEEKPKKSKKDDVDYDELLRLKDEEYKQKFEMLETKTRMKEIEAEFKQAKIRDTKFLSVLGVKPADFYDANGNLDTEKLKSKIIEAKTTHSYLFNNDNAVAVEETITLKKADTAKNRESFLARMEKTLQK